MTVPLTPESITAFHQMLENPSQHKLPFMPISECFVKSETVTAKDVLAKAYLEYIERPLPKVILYIIMDNMYGQTMYKADNGSAGYFLEINPKCKHDGNTKIS